MLEYYFEEQQKMKFMVLVNNLTKFVLQNNKYYNNIYIALFITKCIKYI